MAAPCIIVASGQSAKGFIPHKGIPVIAVNGVIDWIDRADYWFTLDLSPANRYRMRIQRIGVEYHAAVRSDQETPTDVMRWERIAYRDTEPDKYTPEWWLWRWSGVKGISRHQGQINTGNSAWGALQLAIHLGFDRIMLIGVDGNQNPRIEGGKPNKLSHLPLLFNSAIGEVDMVNCGYLKSDIPTMTIEEGLKWLLNQE